MGGFLARPAVTWPDFFNATGVFGRFPYLLPNLVVAFVVFTGLLGAIFFLPEVKKSTEVPAEEEWEASRLTGSEGEIALDKDGIGSTPTPHVFEYKPVWKQPQAVLAAFQYTALGMRGVIASSD